MGKAFGRRIWQVMTVIIEHCTVLTEEHIFRALHHIVIARNGYGAGYVANERGAEQRICSTKGNTRHGDLVYLHGAVVFQPPHSPFAVIHGDSKIIFAQPLPQIISQRKNAEPLTPAQLRGTFLHSAAVLACSAHVYHGFVGVGASRVRDLFRQAKEKAPCIVFIDEIDAVGRARGKAAAMGGNDERENTLNQLLTEMDGFGSNSGVIILAATNRVDVLDKALLRAGRFDRQIHVDLPDLNERKEVFGVHLRPIKIDNTVDVELLARQTPGFSGADIANVCNEAALIAARHGKKFVEKQDFLDAVDRIVGGLEKKTKITTEEERRSIAIHEAGHASISWLLEYANPLIKVTIVPRGRALGAAWYLPEERQITTKEQMLDEMCATLGGRAAEDLFIGRISTGAMNDLERVTKQAYGMIAYLGMSDKLPNLCYYNNDEYSFNRPYSEKTAELIDEEVKRMVNEQYERAKKILSDNKEGHNKLAQLLIDKEVIFAEDVEEIFGKRPWASRSEEIISASKTSRELKEAEEKEAAKAKEAEKEVKEEESHNTGSNN